MEELPVESTRIERENEGSPLRILTVAARIAGTGELPETELTEACRALVASLDSAAPEAIVQSLTEVLVQRNVDTALQWLQEIGFVASYLPELEATVDLPQEAGRHHKDVWEHTKLVVKQAVPRPIVRWSALLHDIGKVPTRTFTDNGVHFHGHAEVGARMFDKMVRRLPFERTERRAIRFLIKHHLRSAQYEESWTDSAVRRFYIQMDEHLRDLLDLSRADITSKRPGRRRALLHQISALSDRIEALRAQDAKEPALPKGLGTALMERFGLPPSKELGNLIKALTERVEAGELERQRELDYYLDYVAASDLLG